MSTSSHSPLRPILLGGLIAGVADITYAFVILRARGVIWVLQSVASGLLGANAFSQGLGAAALGAVCHFLIAITAAAVYYLISRKLLLLVRHAVVCGLLYGVAVYLFMNFVVLKISAFPFKLSYPPATLIKGFIGHALLVGLPIALATRWYSQGETSLAAAAAD